MIFLAAPSKIFPCRQFFFPAVSKMKLWNVSFAQRYFLSVAFISCLPALLSFTGSKFPCEFVSCCCSGEQCFLYLTDRFTWGSAATTTTKPGSRSSTPMILQGHAFGISHRVSWKQEHNCVNALFFLMSNSSPSLSPRMEQDVVTRTGICLSAGCGMIQGWNNASPLR